MRSYWAKAKAEELVDSLKRRREMQLNYLTSSGLYDRIARSWRMYHAVPEGSGDSYHGSTIRIAGEDGEFRVTEMNEFRSSIGLLKTYVTNVRPEWDCLAATSSPDAYAATKKANRILDTYTTNLVSGVEKVFNDVAELSLVMTTGFVWAHWDENLGNDLEVDVKGDKLLREGEFDFIPASAFDVSYNYRCRRYEDSPWVEIRRLENRYDVAAGAKPSLREQILNANTNVHDEYEKFDFRPDALDDEADEDLVWVSYFWHKETQAIPNGRFLRRLGDIVLDDKDHLPEGHIPVHRLSPGDFLLSPFGYSQSFDCQAPQELMNAAISTVATNQNALGTNKVWFKDGEPINQAELESGVTAISSDTPPKVLNLLQTAPEIFKAIEMYQGLIRGYSGVNDTAHGNPGANLKSGAALAFTEQRVQQAASGLVNAYLQLQAAVGKSIITTLKHRAITERTVQAKGVAGKSEALKFTSEEMKAVDDVVVVRGNPLLQTLGGRIQVAETLLQSGQVDAKEYLTVVQTGDLSKLTERTDRQRDIIHREDEAFRSGIANHKALVTDNHIEHSRSHLSVLDTPEAREDENIAKLAYAAALEHKDMSMDPEVIEWQILLGYMPPEMMANAQAAGQGLPPPEAMKTPEGNGPVPDEAPNEGPARLSLDGNATELGGAAI